MVLQIPKRFQSAIHDYRCRGVLRTPPLKIVPSGLMILSMLRHADVIMYLVAIKSFYRQVGHGQVVVVDDGTLTAEDRAIISNHAGSPRFINSKDVDTGSCPTYTSWRRLFSVLALTKDSYVVQLDADTVTTGDIPEVKDCIRSNRSFTLGTTQGLKFITLTEASTIARNAKGSHVQDEAERCFGNFPDAATTFYVRGSAGFTGFAKGMHDPENAEAFSAKVTEQIGKKWTQWGSEQVTSNYLISNSDGAVILPHPRYAIFERVGDPKDSSFLHFVGTNRYDDGVYTRESLSVISSRATPLVSRAASF